MCNIYVYIGQKRSYDLFSKIKLIHKLYKYNSKGFSFTFQKKKISLNMLILQGCTNQFL